MSDPAAYRRVSHLVGLVQEPRGVLLRVVTQCMQDERAARACPRPSEKVSPTTASGTEDALDCPPTTTIWGRPAGQILAARRVDAVASGRRLWWGFAGGGAGGAGVRLAGSVEAPS